MECSYIVDPDDNVSGRVLSGVTYRMVEEFARAYSQSRAVDVVIYDADGVKLSTIIAGVDEVVYW